MTLSSKDEGCDVCRLLWASGRRPPELAMSITLHTRLYRCEVCGSYWEENERYANVIPENTVRADYPGVIYKEK